MSITIKCDNCKTLTEAKNEMIKQFYHDTDFDTSYKPCDFKMSGVYMMRKLVKLGLVREFNEPHIGTFWRKIG